ncbi:MAG: hypothetical protein RLY21_1510 [Planctomycetota bacterium]|jgi:PAS domain S-box-containing protein
MSEPFVESALLHLPDALITIDRTSTVLFVNRAAERLFGFTSAEFVGRTLMETIIPMPLAPQHRRGMDRFLESGHGPVIGRRIEITARDREGRVFPIELTVFLDPAQQGKLFYATIREVSDRVADAARARAEHERLRQFLDASADAWWDCRLGVGTTFSDGFAAVLGRAGGLEAADDPAHAPWIHADDRQRVIEQWEAHLAGATARYECSYRVVGGERERWMRDRGRAVEFADGRPVRVVGTTADVTEQHEAEERLHSAKRLEMLGILAGGFAHDLNNLLAAIRGQAALLATEAAATPATVEALESIQLATTKAKMLTSNMLSLGKPRQSEVRRFALCAMIEDIARIVRIGLPKSIALSLDLDGAAGLDLEMDASAFQQAMLNLLLNARDAMPAGGALRVSAVAASGADDALWARITVEDSGHGIAPADLPRIFEPFFTTKPKGVGTGLGLAVVARAVAGAHGKVSVQSDVGHGARFTLELPALPAAETPAQTPALPVGALRVLLAEDHPLLRAMLAEVLRAQGHSVVDCASGADAARFATESGTGFDLHVLDLGLPVIGGEAVQRQAEQAHGRAIPVVFVSGVPNASVDSGVFRRMRLLAKPFDIADFAQAIRAVVAAPAD